MTANLNSDATFTEEERAQAREEIRLKDEREYREFIERSWLDLCPRIYNEPLDYAKIKPEMNHLKIRDARRMANISQRGFCYLPD